MQTSKVRPEPKIPDHEVLRKIGGGAYGEVWLAQGVTGALRAVKTVWHNDFEDERGFEREFEGILKYEPISRDHPGLVHILHVGRAESESEPFYYYVMELGDDVVMGREINPVEYEPRTLRSDMKATEGQALDTEECITAGRLLAGLEHLHQHGLAHRDVKPSNVIFVDGKAKLADIGLVAQRGQQTFVGTEGFVPPEGPGSAQADVYSLGKVLYEMATGKDRLDFPELPDELPEGSKLKRWRFLNSVICDVCEPKISRRKIKSAGELAAELARLEAGRRRPVRVNGSLVAALFAMAIGVVGATQFLQWGPVEVPSSVPPPVVLEPVKMALVTISSDPLNVEVYSAEGAYLGDTPLDVMKVPVGSRVRYTLRELGYRDEPLSEIVPEEGLVLVPSLKIYAPPRAGDNWVDVLGMRYGPVQDFHKSKNYVGIGVWMQYREKTKLKVGQIVEVTEKGVVNQVVLATVAEARAFAKWLTKECRDGYIEEDNWIEPLLDEVREIPEFGQEAQERTRHPFYTVVKREPRAMIMIASEPAGADVYLNGEYAGKTTRLPLEPLSKEVKAGPVEVIIEAEGYLQLKDTRRLKPNEVWEEPWVYTLKPENVFGRSFVNSLGMKLEPVSELMASAWETRVKDYARFVEDYPKFIKEYAPYLRKIRDPKRQRDLRKEFNELVVAAKDNVQPPPEPTFEQGPDHPVVNVTVKEASLFCRWLTLKERKSGEIAPNHEYRLPTDLEWSRMARLRDEVGETPQARAVEGRPGFPWGGLDWPPPETAGNFSDVAAAVPAEKKIPGFEDGFDKTSSVGSFLPNGLMLYDLAGNAHELVSDDYSDAGAMSVARGGGWNSYDKRHLRTSARIPVPKDAEPANLYGFRVVLAKVPVIPEKEAAQANNTP